MGKKLQGNVATQLKVFGFIDHTHAAAPNFAEDAVMGNRLTNGLGWSGHLAGMVRGRRVGVNLAQKAAGIRFRITTVRPHVVLIERGALGFAPFETWDSTTAV
jgi:hypothetical protein